MKRLQIPSTLAVTLAATITGCTPTQPSADAGDATGDRPSADVVADTFDGYCDYDAGQFNARPICARPSDAGFESYEYCSERGCGDTCPAGCRPCLARPFGEGIGLFCTPTRGSAAQCPPTVCAESECPQGCQTCTSTLFCIPDEVADGGERPVCDHPQTVCDPTACQPGCRAVG
jgi:hypothetical protein